MKPERGQLFSMKTETKLALALYGAVALILLAHIGPQIVRHILAGGAQ